MVRAGRTEDLIRSELSVGGLAAALIRVSGRTTTLIGVKVKVYLEYSQA